MKKLLALLCLASLVVAPACCCKRDKCCKEPVKKEKKVKKERGARKEKTTKKHHKGTKATKEVMY